MPKIYTADNGKHLEERYNEIISELKKTNNYSYICGRLEVIIEDIIAELKAANS